MTQDHRLGNRDDAGATTQPGDPRYQAPSALDDGRAVPSSEERNRSDALGSVGRRRRAILAVARTTAAAGMTGIRGRRPARLPRRPAGATVCHARRRFAQAPPGRGRSAVVVAHAPGPRSVIAESRASVRRRGQAARRCGRSTPRPPACQRRAAPRGTPSAARRGAPTPPRDPARGRLRSSGDGTSRPGALTGRQRGLPSLSPCWPSREMPQVVSESAS